MAQRILTGYRPTGKLHLGNLHGNLKEMIELQEKAECFFFIADWHALTTDYQDPSCMREYTEEMVLDWLAAGIDPGKAAVYRQSDLPEVAEFQLYLSMITPLGWLERVPSFKEQQEQLQGKDISTHGFLGYPVLQAADILMVRADGVPVGEDQLPHLELTREIVRRFNFLYGETFKEPQSLLSRSPRIPGTDGRKMSKSYGNFISLTDPPDEMRKKVLSMITDPARRTRKDPGDPEKCSAFAAAQDVHGGPPGRGGREMPQRGLGLRGVQGHPGGPGGGIATALPGEAPGAGGQARLRLGGHGGRPGEGEAPGAQRAG